MFSRVVALMVAFGIVAATAGAQETDATRWSSPEEAWALARGAMGDSDRWVPGSSTITIEMLDRNGRSDRTIVLEQQILEAGEDLVLSMVPISVSSGRSGLPTPPTAEPDTRMGRMPSREAGQQAGPGAQLPVDPFSPTVASTVALSEAREARSIGGIDAVEYGIAWSDADGSEYVGSIWINADTGSPVRLEVIGEMAEDEIREFETMISYEEQGGVVLPARSVTRASRRVNLFLTARTRINVAYTEYFETDGTRAIVLGGMTGQEE